MRLPPVLIAIIAKGIVKTLSVRGVIASEKPSDTISKLERLLNFDLQKDEELTNRAKSLLESRYDEIKALKDVDFRQLLGKAKKELAAKENFIPWGGSDKISPDKILQLSAEILEFFKRDEDLEYFVPPENLRREITLAFDKERMKDSGRIQKANAKVRSIKRNIPEGSSEFSTLAEQFYREFLEKER
jgi:uncharacterized protein